MRSTLQELWYGNLCPRAQLTEECDELNTLQQRVARHYSILYETCSNTQKDLLRRYENCLADYKEQCGQQHFVQGFRLGAQLMLEMLSEQERT